ncbi:MAG: ABC-F family ATP-binding cassette domain-containing protein [Rhizobiales bacterium]|nr:ATP-binding cassette domain-containing protein [Hyphomicrobiales bacterium]NRB15276.1 ABC-F family ATP-binding cassette domain-containing protein [Hyphomicrobiales bacterium]
MSKPLLAAQNIDFGYGHEKMFNDLTLHIGANDRVGLVGTNGCGKSTLLKILSKTLDISSGEIINNNRMVMSVVDQFVPTELAEQNIYDIILAQLPAELRDDSAYLVDIILKDMGFAEVDFGKNINEISGGQVNLVLMARAMINEPDLLLMDEPSNHLDVEAIVKLEEFFIDHYKNAFLIISHDVELLDKITNKTIFIKDGKAYQYGLAYSAARVEFLAFEDNLKKQRALEEKEIDRLSATAKRLAIWGREHDNEKFARKAKSIEKKIVKLDDAKTETFNKNKYKLDVKTDKLRVKTLLEVQNYQVKTLDGARNLYKIDGFYINNGDRIILFGANGVGKSTFVKNLVAKFGQGFGQDNVVDMRFNPQVSLGYYDQEQEQLDGSKTIFNFLNDLFDLPDLTIQRAILQAGFGYDEMDKKISILSGGEKARILFTKLNLQQPNFIILDEPTNHIDLYGREELIKQLTSSGATLLIIGHDRKFCNIVGNRFFMIERDKLVEIDDAGVFYNSLKGDAPIVSALNTAAEQIAEEQLVNDEDSLLERVLELETLLESDLARKPKHQKPALQKQWQAEISKIYAGLNV